MTRHPLLILSLVAVACQQTPGVETSAPHVPPTDSETTPPTDTEPVIDSGCVEVDRFEDLDGDGYGGAAARACAGAAGFAWRDGDCEDNNASVHPAARELCDGIDQDCDGSLDDEPVIAYLDADGDGYGSAPASCPPEPGAVATRGDCDDLDGAVFPGALDHCNGVDDDCDGVVDEGPGPAIGLLDGASSDCDAFGEHGNVASVPYAEVQGHESEDFYNGVTAADANGDGVLDILITVGTYLDPSDLTSHLARGAIYVMEGPFAPSEYRTPRDAIATIIANDDDRLYKTAEAGDVNGDGFTDFMSVGTWIPKAFLLYGPFEGTTHVLDSGRPFDPGTVEGEIRLAHLPPGDINGDGLDDVAIEYSTELYDDAVKVFFGPADRPFDEPNITFEDTAKHTYSLGNYLGGVGDITGDGRPELAISNLYALDSPYGEARATYLVSDPPTGSIHPAETGVIIGIPAELGHGYGGIGTLTVRNVGDTDGDGYDDLALVATDTEWVLIHRGPFPTEGFIDVYEDATASLYLEDYGVVEPALEYAVPRGDVDGDGTADLAINAHDFTRRSVADCEWKEPRFCYDGAVFLVNGPFEGQINLLDEPDAISGGGVFSFLGQSISGGPDTDLDLDGRSDLVVSAKGPTAEDVALVLFGVGAP